MKFQSLRKVLSLLMCLFTFGVCSAIEIEINGIKYDVIKKANVARLIDANRPSGTFKVPEFVTYEGAQCQVVEISASAFFRSESLNNVHIPKSVKKIGYNSFSECLELKSVYITDIAAWCNIQFDNLSSNPVYDRNLYVDNQLATNLIIPMSVSIIKKLTFAGCSSITNVSIPKSVTKIEESAFDMCPNLSTIEIPNSVLRINKCAFRSCENLKSITIPNQIKEIEAGLCWGCKSLETIKIPKTVILINGGAFANCEGLKDVYCYAVNPPQISYDCFDNSEIEYATLYVPAASIQKYKSHVVWKRFGKIVAIK